MKRKLLLSIPLLSLAMRSEAFIANTVDTVAAVPSIVVRPVTNQIRRISPWCGRSRNIQRTRNCIAPCYTASTAPVYRAPRCCRPRGRGPIVSPVRCPKPACIPTPRPCRAKPDCAVKIRCCRPKKCCAPITPACPPTPCVTNQCNACEVETVSDIPQSVCL